MINLVIENYYYAVWFKTSDIQMFGSGWHLYLIYLVLLELGYLDLNPLNIYVNNIIFDYKDMHEIFQLN